MSVLSSWQGTYTPIAGVRTYLFKSSGAYMGKTLTTDANREVGLFLSANGVNSTNYNGYKFRTDYSEMQTWNNPVLFTVDVNNSG